VLWQWLQVGCARLGNERVHEEYEAVARDLARAHIEKDPSTE